MFYRTDIDACPRITLAALASCLSEIRTRYGDGALLTPNGVGNLAIQTPAGESIERTPTPNGIGMFYVGYIDLAQGDVVWETTGINHPFRNDHDVHRVDGGRRA